MSATNDVFGRRSGHEQVVYCQDATSGLQAIIAIYSTALGPGLGGTRFHPYPSEAVALEDVLRLSRAMAYKNSLAGLDHGGAKAVIVGDPATGKTEALLRAYGRFVQSLAGRYYTAADVGTTVADMDVIARECRYVTGRSELDGGAGDSSVLTAYGVFQGMRACAAHSWGAPTLAGRRVGVAGVGKVGSALVGHLIADGAAVVISDVNEQSVDRIRQRHPGVEVAPSTTALIGADLDVYAPCALGGALTEDTVAALSATVVCGGANNQLAHPGIGDLLSARGILYAPDYVVNAGGVIQVADEIHGFDFARAKARAAKIYDTTRQILETAAAEGVAPSVAADGMAERLMSEGTRSIGAGHAG